MKIVLTGGPCSGKSTLINRLKERGYSTISESAKEIIAQTKDFTDSRTFQLNITLRQLKKEREISGLTFLDRGVFDGFYYSRMNFGFVPIEIYSIASGTIYDAVFVPDLIPFKNEGFRLESSQEEAESIHIGIINIYKSLGYSPIHVPVLPLDQRVDFILYNVQKLKGDV